MYSMVVAFLLIILSMVWIGFITLDKKIDKAIDEQGKINNVSYELNKEQSAAIRQLKTDSEILMNIAINQDYSGGLNDNEM